MNNTKITFYKTGAITETKYLGSNTVDVYYQPTLTSWKKKASSVSQAKAAITRFNRQKG